MMENGSIIHQGKYAEILDVDQGAFRGVAELPEQCEYGPGLPETVRLHKINGNGITKNELEGPSIPSINACNMPQTPDMELTEPVQDDKGIIDTQHDLSVEIVSDSKGSSRYR